MSGILARGEHRLAAVDNVHQAWNFIRRNAQVDLVFSELTLSGTSGRRPANRRARPGRC